MLLAGDVGGTKTDLAIYSNEAGPHSPLAEAEVHSADYPSLQAIVTEFLFKAKISVDRACFDVAGPVIEGHVKTTNLPWSMDESSLAKELNLKSVHLMNDLEAMAWAIPVLRPTDMCTLNVGYQARKVASRLSRRVRVWASHFSLGMDHITLLTARKAVTQTLPRRTSARFACLNTCSSASTTSASNTSVPELGFPTSINVFARSNMYPGSPKSLS